MEKVLPLLVPAFVGVLGCRLLLAPLKRAIGLLLHSACGFLCLWLLNLMSGVTGLTLPVNPVTVLVTGTLGLPGIGLILLLELL